MTRRVTARVVALLIAGLLLPAAARANQASRELRDRGTALGYNLDFDQAVAMYAKAIAAAPSDPASYRARAAEIWLHIMFMRGLVTSDNYLGRFARPPASMRTPPPELAAQFTSDLNQSLTLSLAQVKAHPDSADAHYQLGATYGLQASYAATVGDDRRAAFGAARRAYREEAQTMQLDPSRADAGLIVGTYRYMVASLSWSVRWLAYLVGFQGGKDEGIRLIEGAGRYPGENQHDAKMALILIYNREHRYADALRMLDELERGFPANRLLWLEAGATALRADRAADAERYLDEGIAKLDRDDRPRMFGEEALWYYERGAARVALGRREEAAADLNRALGAHGRVWVEGRVHTELGKLADLAGHHQIARAEYRAAEKMADQDDDPVGKDAADELLQHGYHPPTAAHGDARR